MPNCDKCGFQLPDGASFCPNCGATVKKKMEVSESPRKSVMNLLKMGLLGAFLSVTLSSFSLIPLYFVPSFISSLIVIFLSKARRIEDATWIAMSVYLFENAIIASMVLASNLIVGQVELSQTITLVDLIMFIAYPVTALVAGYIGVNLVPKKKEEPLPVPYKEGEERGPGGIVYSLKRNPEEISAP